MAKRPILENIRALLTEEFFREELFTLCFDHFRPVHNQLYPELSKTEIIDHLLKYAERNLQLDELLVLAKEHSPVIYEKHQPYLEEVAKTFSETTPYKQYDLWQIHTLLTEGFAQKELRRLIFDIPDFRPVYNQLDEEVSKAEIIDRLLEYAAGKSQLETLLTWAKKHNPARFESHQPYLAEAVHGRTHAAR